MYIIEMNSSHCLSLFIKFLFFAGYTCIRFRDEGIVLGAYRPMERLYQAKMFGDEKFVDKRYIMHYAINMTELCRVKQFRFNLEGQYFF